ncbi:MAG: hypothetical protein WDN75_09515 [Bacteroidota bacterium]
MIITTIDPSGTVTISGPTLKCQDEVATFNVVSTTNPGASPAFTWYVNDSEVDNGEGGITITNGGAHMQVAHWNFANNSTVKCSMVSNSSCHSGSATSNTITVVRQTPAVMTVSILKTISTHNANKYCVGEPIGFTVSSDHTATYSWKQYGSGVGTGSTYTSTITDPEYDGCCNSVQVTATTLENCVSNPVQTVTYPLTNIIFSPAPTLPSVPAQLAQYNSDYILTATGAGDTETYNWYGADGLYLGQGLSFQTPVLLENTNYSVAKYDFITSCQG